MYHLDLAPLFYNMVMDRQLREGGENRKKVEEYIKEGEMGGGILFFQQIDVIHLNRATPAAHSQSDQHLATPKGKWNCIVDPLFSPLFQAIRDDICPLFCHESKQTKRQPVVICIAVLLPLKIYYSNARMHRHTLTFRGWSYALLPRSFSLELLLYCAR